MCRDEKEDRPLGGDRRGGSGWTASNVIEKKVSKAWTRVEQVEDGGGGRKNEAEQRKKKG